MRSALNIILLSLLGLSLSFCGTFSKNENKEPTNEDVPKYENYHSSGVYNDIESEGRTVSSEDYSDDEYGEVDTGEEAAQESDGLISDSGQEADNETESDPLPVEKLQQPKAQANALPKKTKAKVTKKVASVGSFTNGMHAVTSNCTMHSKADSKSKGVGLVNKGKKLWMENHNGQWVKVFKKSGPVYISKDCL